MLYCDVLLSQLDDDFGRFDLLAGLEGFFPLFIAGRSGARMYNPTPSKDCAEGAWDAVWSPSLLLATIYYDLEIQPPAGNVVPCIAVVRARI